MITRLDHATIFTNKLEETRAFFVDGVGLEVGSRPPGKHPGYWLYCDGRAVIHLASGFEDRPSVGAIDHVAFSTDDLDATLARLDRIGVKYTRFDSDGGRFVQAVCNDPNGVNIEINWQDAAG